MPELRRMTWRRKCGCGCGKSVNRYKGKKRRFLSGHSHSGGAIPVHNLVKFGKLGNNADSFFRYNIGIGTGEASKEIVFLVMLFKLSIAKIKGRYVKMKASTLMSEIKSSALKQIAESLNDTLEKIQSKEIDVKQGTAEIIAHKHIIQTIALDWTFNGTTKKIKEIVNLQK